MGTKSGNQIARLRRTFTDPFLFAVFSVKLFKMKIECNLPPLDDTQFLGATDQVPSQRVDLLKCEFEAILIVP